MNKIGATIVLLGVVAFGLLVLTKVNAAPGGGGGSTATKFKTGDYITSPSRLPTDVIYVIIEVYQSAGVWLYTLGQWYGGQVINRQSGYSAATIDANYVIV